MTEIIAAVLLVLSELFVLLSAIGFVRPADFFERIHPPALAYTGGTWTVALAGVLVYSAGWGKLALHPLLIIVLLFITVPVTSLLLARAVLFRRREYGTPGTPPPLQPMELEPQPGKVGESETGSGSERPPSL